MLNNTEDIVAIPLKNCKKYFYVSYEDYRKVSRYDWSLTANGRVVHYRMGATSRTLLLSTCLGRKYHDHIDRNNLNNTRSNLRKASQAQNGCNKIKYKKNSTSKYKGVHFDKKACRWYSSICFERKRHFLGYFETEVEAAVAYNKSAINLHGEFAVLNII